MEIVFDTYTLNEIIPVSNYLKNKKLAKYFNRETAAALVCVGKLLNDKEIREDMPVYYATSMVEYEDYGLQDILSDSLEDGIGFSEKLFIEKAMPKVSPLTQFKVLYNMPVSFISIEYNLTGDNAVLYQSGRSLLHQAFYSNYQGAMLIGAGRVTEAGTVESGFALIDSEELNRLDMHTECDPIDLMKLLQENTKDE